MHSDLATRRRVLLLTYQRYIEAERAWTFAQQELRCWFPATSRISVPSIGDPGSHIRRLHEQRERSVHQLEVARLKLEVAKQRLAKRHQETHVAGVLFVTHRHQ
ncbi:hypothetical protein EYC08_19875 [Tabrizicola sp. WMC-M-20]|nr:hypothetical protein EYC08_19875 [Tabrizicola sp. WMC-M-20]